MRSFNQLYDAIYKIQYDKTSSPELKEVGKYIREDTEDMLRVTGEYGRLPEHRLGVPEGTKITDMAVVAMKKARLWNGKASDWMMSNEYMEASSIVNRSYEIMHYHLNALIGE